MTQIKRLFQSKTEFVPITLSEAVVVNTSGIPGLSSLGITTLDKVLRNVLGIIGTNAGDINALEEIVNNINIILEDKQDKLTAGTGINISPDGVISTTFGVELYKIVTTLPTASEDLINSIYLVPSSDGIAGNIFSEFLCVYSDLLKKYVWEKVGEVLTDTDLSGYVTKDEFDTAISNINKFIDVAIWGEDVTTSTGIKVVVDYSIPDDLYDNAINLDNKDQIIGG